MQIVKTEKKLELRIFQSQKELQGQPCDRIELHKRTHKSDKHGWSTKEAEENWNLMIEKKKQCDQDGDSKTAVEIVEEVLGRGSAYIKVLGYGPKPPSKCMSSNFVTQQLEKELLETRQKLQNSETKVDELTTEVTSLKDKLSEQGANIDKLMAFMTSNQANHL